MINLLTCTDDDLPIHLRWQILSGLRAVWPEAFKTHRPQWISRPDFHPLYLILVESDFVLAHTVVMWKYLQHANERYKIYGLSMVFTYPDCRGQGYGLQIVRAGGDYIERSDGDVGMLFCQPNLRKFYSRCGWTPVDSARTLVEENGQFFTTGELLLMKFLSERGKQGQISFYNEPIYFGDTTW
jgi:hypothetical protein